jgi:tripartite-type tricarboxylate transporter receptor subunit TctC
VLRLISLIFIILASASMTAQAQTFPDKPIRMIIGYAPGGATDTVGRLLAQELSQILGQSVIVENRAGGGTLVATETVKRSPADGYTLLFGTNAFIITPLLHEKPTYDPAKDFEPVALTTVQSLALLLSPTVPFQSIQELITFAKNNPGKINFASSGNGSAQHLTGEAFRTAAGIDIAHVPYKGSSPAQIDLLAGRVDMMFTSLVGNMDHIQHNRLKLIAVTGSHRSVAVPLTPTVAESGLPDFEAYTWQGILAPAGTPAKVIDTLNRAVLQAAHSRKIIDTLAAQGMEVQTSSPQEMGTLLDKESRLYKKLLRQTQTSIH